MKNIKDNKRYHITSTPYRFETLEEAIDYAERLNSEGSGVEFWIIDEGDMSEHGHYLGY